MIQVHVVVHDMIVYQYPNVTMLCLFSDPFSSGFTDEESLTGSTVDLIRPGSARSSTYSEKSMSNVQIF